MKKKFDLNVDNVLESWEPCHAIRELIANALDLQILSNTAAIEVRNVRLGEWTIKDYGRGLSYSHLIQTENPEKLKAENLIGRFGVGLKDALATLWRHQISVEILSKFGIISLERSSKHSFEDVITLHACVEDTSSTNMIGTEIMLTNCNERHVLEAKKMFMHFQNSQILESNQFGQVINSGSVPKDIYLNGLKIASEESFLFSYNVTAPNKSIKKALNRERMNVGRAAYSERIKNILLNCRSKNVCNKLAEDLEHLAEGNHHDELNWLEIQTYACDLLQSQKTVVFVTSDERTTEPNLIAYAKADGLKAVTIPDRLREKVESSQDAIEPKVQLLSVYADKYNQSYQYEFVSLDELSADELEVYKLIDVVYFMIGGKPTNVRDVAISENMRDLATSGFDALGTWTSEKNQIVLKRSLLKDRKEFLATFLHELAHATSHAADVSLVFENQLTKFLGLVATSSLMQKNSFAGKSELMMQTIQDCKSEIFQLKNENRILTEENEELVRSFARLADQESPVVNRHKSWWRKFLK